ncbi:nitrate reductase [Mergibacter septicus]|uniref:Chaperone NapD n=1 Tax=Mergibacter septicus TaxID=221402 RepID=A0A8D4LIT3_9PAST|nr:chaperone NapD [Mergibacter septicus]AWX14845.1 nitrate reductase [Mergibacter septicus]QDJ13479.1 nitrate reductase [Mergibacter septicus]QDJ14097.1 nitrate reductase [Mergibacter septicus]UTU48453.1 chaperone NapD [Mergibacter septicus]WMR95918.1 chaperone NapD [Mergibacter septicus]
MKNTVTIENAKEWHVCSLIVQGLPTKLAQIKQALLAISLTEIYASDDQNGKIVVVMQSHNQRQLLQQIEDARNIDGVITVSLVYHQQDVE